MLQMVKKLSSIMVTPINNGETNLKINFTRYCLSMLINIFLPSFGYYLKALTWWNLNSYILLTYTSNISPFKNFQLSVQNLSISKRVSLWKWAILTWNFQNFQNGWYLTCMLVMAKNTSSIKVTLVNNGEMNLKISFSRYCFTVLRNIFTFIWLLFEWFNMVKISILNYY